MKLCMGCMESIEDRVTTCPHCGYDETTLRQESYYLAPGTIVGGKYIVGRVLGYGGYTVTYLGMDAELNRKIMVKEYLPSDFSTRSEGEREVTIYSGDALEQFEQGLTTFLNEANRIQHLENIPGIAKVYDCVAENDTGYVISEYLEGHTLKEVLDSGRSFTPQEAKNFISHILEGLRLVHPLDVIHCDIAPETIMITNTGEIKLLDFGATRYVTTANSKSLAIILKQGYAPEEQYRSRGSRGPWTDVYALAAVMYRMITGLVPDESVDRALVDELKEPSKLGIQIPKNMENAMMNALNVYQKDRTLSAEVFLSELNSPEVKRIQVKKKKYETGKFPRWAKGLVAGLVCVVIAGGGFLWHQSKKGDVKQADNKNDKFMEDLIGETEKGADDKLKKAGIQEYDKKFHYEETPEKIGKVSAQNPTRGVLISKDKPYYDIGTDQKCSFEDIRKEKDSVFNLDNGLKEFCKEAENDNRKGEAYGKFYAVVLKESIKLENGETTNILKEENLETEGYIDISNIKSIQYYVGPFWYVKSLKKNYEGDNINTAKFMWQKYIRDKNNKLKEIEGEEGKGQPPHNGKYISLSNDYKEGDIVKQHFEKGTRYDYSKKKKALFDTVGKQISWSEKTGAQFRKELIDIIKIPEKNISYSSSSDAENNPISGISVSPDQKVKKGALFLEKNVSDIKVVITTKKPLPTPPPASQPTQRPSTSTQPPKKGQPQKKGPHDGVD